MNQPLNQRGILKGVQCVCGQWWPDFVRTENALQFRTECCGAVYHYTVDAQGKFSTLSLLEDPRASRLEDGTTNAESGGLAFQPAPEFIPMTSPQAGQRWSHPGGGIVTITRVTKHWVHYRTDADGSGQAATGWFVQHYTRCKS